MANKIEREIEKLESDAREDYSASSSEKLTPKEIKELLRQYTDINVTLKIFDTKVKSYFSQREEALKSNGKVKVPELMIEHKFELKDVNGKVVGKNSDSVKNFFPNVYGKRLVFNSKTLGKDSSYNAENYPEAEGKDVISSEMAWAQIDSRFKMAFDEMAGYLIDGQQERFFNMCKQDVYLARDLVGMTLVVQNILAGKENRARDMMIHFGLGKRLGLMKQFFNCPDLANFAETYDKIISDAKSQGITEEQLKKQADRNLTNSTVQTISTDATNYAYETVDGKTVIKKNQQTELLDIFNGNNGRNHTPKGFNTPKVVEASKKLDETLGNNHTNYGLAAAARDFVGACGSSKSGRIFAGLEIFRRIVDGKIPREETKLVKAVLNEQTKQIKSSESCATYGAAKRKNDDIPESKAVSDLQDLFREIFLVVGELGRSTGIGFREEDFEIVETNLKKARAIIDSFDPEVIENNKDLRTFRDKVVKYEQEVYGVEVPENVFGKERDNAISTNERARKLLLQKKKLCFSTINKELENIDEITNIDEAVDKVHNILESIISLPKGMYIDYTEGQIAELEQALVDVDKLIERFGEDLVKGLKDKYNQTFENRREDAKKAVQDRKERSKINQNKRDFIKINHISGNVPSEETIRLCMSVLSGIIDLGNITNPSEIKDIRERLDKCRIWCADIEKFYPDRYPEIKKLLEEADENFEKINANMQLNITTKNLVNELKTVRFEEVKGFAKLDILKKSEINRYHNTMAYYVKFKREGLLSDEFIVEFEEYTVKIEATIEYQKSLENNIKELNEIREVLKGFIDNPEGKNLNKNLIEYKRTFENIKKGPFKDKLDKNLIAEIEEYFITLAPIVKKHRDESEGFYESGETAEKQETDERDVYNDSVEDKGDKNPVGVAEPVGKSSDVLHEAQKGVEGTTQGRTGASKENGSVKTHN